MNGTVVDVNELRELRRAADLSQRQLADLLDIPFNTFRMWDSGLTTSACAYRHSGSRGPRRSRPDDANSCRWRNWPENSACTSARCRPRRAQDG